jgi:hypothetical protein
MKFYERNSGISEHKFGNDDEALQKQRNASNE